ncbi:MAG: CBS domain-containing protein [Candidatus Omnitrophica bacterium]|nr:CBS domain-containing protein [Candidatus Omnitrophota bacterium]
MKIKEVMVKKVITLSPDTPVKDATAKLSELEISGLPVVDSAGKLVGMFTEKEVLKFILPSYVEQVGRFVYENTSKGIQNKMAAMNNLKVKDLMRKDVTTVKEDTSLFEVARIMLTQKVRRIAVVDDSAKLVGIVSRADVMKGMTDRK